MAMCCRLTLTGVAHQRGHFCGWDIRKCDLKSTFDGQGPWLQGRGRCFSICWIGQHRISSSSTANEYFIPVLCVQVQHCFACKWAPLSVIATNTTFIEIAQTGSSRLRHCACEKGGVKPKRASQASLLVHCEQALQGRQLDTIRCVQQCKSSRNTNAIVCKKSKILTELQQ